MGSNEQLAEYKDSFFRMASSALSASKVGWTRARQFTEEKLGSAEKTQYDPQFENLCARADRIKFHTERILQNAEAMLQPNPAVRLEEFAYQKLDKKIPARSSNTSHLGQVMEESGHELGAGTNYEGQQLFIGSSLLKTGTTLKKIGNAEKDFMQKSFVQFLHPLRGFLDNEMKTITKERRQLERNRLDLDAYKAKVRKAATAEKMREAENEMRQVQADFDKQYEITKLLLEGMSTVQNNHIQALQGFTEALGMFYTQCQQYTEELQKDLLRAQERPVQPPSRPSAPPFAQAINPSITRKAKVLYDYDAMDKTELSLLADEVVNVYSVEGLDSDWMIAERGSQKGKVPIAYLELL